MDKPVIAFDTPVMRAEIDPGVDGLLVPRQDPQALATAIMQLSENPDLARGFGRRGRTKAVERFDRTKNSRKVLDIYRSLTASPLNGASH
jgi:glycosyltransferase involved in cell wall biosynthesis